MSGGEVPVGRFEAQGRLSLWVLVGLFVVAFAFRAGVGGWRLGRGDNPEVLTFPDEVQYWSMSRDLRAGRTLTDELGFHATRMPAYPAFLAIFPDSRGGVLGAIVCQWIIGALAAPLTALLAVRIGGVAAGVAAGLVVAADPGLVGLSSLLLTETPFVTGVAALWLVGWPIAAECRGVSAGRWLGLGVTAALCVYVRPSTVGLVGLWVVFLLARQRWTGRAWLGALMCGVVVVASLVPWAWRNREVTGHWCWLTHRLGISLYDGVGPSATGAGDLGSIKNMPAVAGLDEYAWNQWFLKESWRSVRADPGRVAGLACRKLARTWSPFLHAEEYRSSGVRLVYGVWSMLFLAAAAGGVWVMRCRGYLLIGLLLPAMYLSALHSVFVGSVRYRMGATPTLAVLAGLMLAAVWPRRRPVEAGG